ncbi:MAG TPA: roadblock/LC7 domain-containing protein [Methylomirabilota bacterium]|nr:roadblock/LC7 domain-containing protein [Methylomirabilota bacterium]
MAVSAHGHPEPAAETPARGRAFRQLLRDLVKLEHVRGGLIVAPDGLVIASDLPREVPVEPLSALGAALGRELELRGPRLRGGTFLMAHFAAGDGTVFLGGTPIGFIVLLGGAEVSRDAVRHALRTALDSVREAWGR